LSLLLICCSQVCCTAFKGACLLPSCRRQKCSPLLLQALRAPHRVWLSRLGMVLVCSPLVELLRKAGVPFYSALSYLSLAASWFTCAIHGILLATGVDGGVSEWAFTLAAGLVGAAMLAAKDDMAKRLADIALLAAMPAEADRIEQLLPADLQNLRTVLIAFGASARAAAELAQRELDGMDRMFRRLGRRMCPWAPRG
jgi:hypothetical protein